MKQETYDELEKLEKQFIIGVTPLTERQKELYEYIQWLEGELKKNEMQRERIVDLTQVIRLEFVKAMSDADK